ncbi:hypothetical protein K503DRAFT_492751 [Rhizopogon vinicolor AM-OR11-026]|uniref:DUF6533 domain-containing protein n=1 Tax=Rhizopogon vinicolor AM-OR11-026 TaxID=1314800 RepID=A0A1B7MME3_9AGAM|nr:hypothetical protein K503DRAFT_492751 [Rhizopogon vinicolor AM-OR11-026]
MAAPISILPAPLLAAAIKDQQVLKYFALIGPTILAYDWFLTIDSELNHVWHRRWGIIELIYLFSRYMPFVDTPIMLLYHFYLVDPSIEVCRTALTAQLMMYCIGMSISGQIFTIRTWAVWERSKVMGLFLLTEAFVAFVVQLCLINIYAKSLTYFQGYNLGGCFVLTSSNVLLVSLSIFLFVQFCMCWLSSSFMASYCPISVPRVDGPEDLPYR